MRSQQRHASNSLEKPHKKRSRHRLAGPGLEKPPREAATRSRIDSCRISHYNS